uniref:Uncharacterized protein n=1 Tax=Anguilla anguilla TaxID=7936 RepID=A0A0E9RHW7_ANGAN
MTLNMNVKTNLMLSIVTICAFIKTYIRETQGWITVIANRYSVIFSIL